MANDDSFDKKSCALVIVTCRISFKIGTAIRSPNFYFNYQEVVEDEDDEVVVISSRSIAIKSL